MRASGLAALDYRPPPRAPVLPIRILNAAWQQIARHLAHRAALANLHDLDDRALDDIGLTRSQIEAAVHGFIPAPSRTRV